MNTYKLFAFLAAFLIMGLAGQVQASSYSLLNPTDDGHVNKALPGENYGTDTYVKSDKERSAYMKFNLEGLAGKPVTKAELKIFISEPSVSTINIRNANDSSWVEKTLTFNTKPAVSAGIDTSFVANQKGVWKFIDVTNAVKANLGKKWSFVMENAIGQTDSMHFYSRNNTSFKPELVIQYADGTVLPSVAPTSVPVVTVVTKVPSPTVKISVTAPTAIPTKTPTKIPTKAPTKAPTAVVTAVVTVPPAPNSGSASYPGQVFSLSNWKLTLPTGGSGSPTEIKQPTLASYKNDPYFLVNSTGNGIRFRAPVNGVTTSGSSYPRSELREMINNGSDGASWSSTSGTHTMYLDEAVTAVPWVKKHVVAGQIHDGGDDVIVIRLEYPKLFIDVNGADGPTLDSNYTLGKRFNVKFVVSGGQTKIYYNGGTTPAYTLNQSYTGAYFKTGAYTQSNCSKEGSANCSSNNFGEVVVYNAVVSHN